MISVPPIGDSAKRVGSYFTPLKVEAQANPNMTVRINAGSFFTALGEYREYAGGNSPLISVPTTSGAKWVVVALNENALIQIFNGVVSNNPTLPTLPQNVLPLAGVFVGDTATVITEDMVFDIRPLWQLHPENIPNLAGELANRPTIADVNTLLLLKADVDGTTEPTFVLNKDFVGVPGSNAELIVERGANPNVSIRWDETAEQWTFSNDGVTWDPIGVASGVFYTKAQLDGGQLDFLYYTKAELDGGTLNTMYYTESEVDAMVAGKADAVHTHVAADVTDLSTEILALVPVKTVAGKTGHITLVEADITDLDKYPTVPGAVPGNLVEFGSGILADSGYAPGDFALAAHTHVAADVTDFAAAADARIAAASIDDLADVQASVAPLDGHVLAYQTASGWYVNRFLNVDELGDVTNSSPLPQHVLIYNGASYVNRLLEKADISDFDEGAYVHTYVGVGSPVPAEAIYGDKTFNGDVLINGNLTVDGGETALLTNELRVQDKFVDINWGETGAGVGGVTPQDAGIRVKRGTEPDALMFWEESTNQWMAGVVGSANPVITGAHSHPWIEVYDFGPGVTVQLALNDLDTMQDVAYPAAPMVGQVLYWNGQWEPTTLVAADISDFATAVTAELNVNSVNEMADVDTTAAAEGNVLFYEGSPMQWVPRDIVKADVADFVEGDFMHTYVGVGSPVPTETAYGNKIFANDVTVGGNVIVTGDLTVNGSNNVINVDTLTVEDNIVEVNKGETGAGVGGGAGNAGIQVDRGTLTDAVLVWDELNTQWEAGVLGSTTGISLQGHLHVLTDVTDVTASALEVNQLNGIALGPSMTVQLQLNDRIQRSVNEAMDPGINLSFSAGGEVLGLPAVPTTAGSAASKAYVDAQVALYDTLAELTDTTIVTPVLGHALMHDGVDWKNRLLVEADISDLGTTIVLDTDIGSTVQAWDADLDTLAGLVHTGDEMIYSNAGTWATTATTAFGRGLLNETDAASTRGTLDLYSATELDAGQLDNRYYTEAELDAGQLDTLYYTELELDGTAGVAGAKIDKVAGAVAGNVATMTAGGEVADGGTLLSDLALTADHYTKVENDAAPGSAGAKVDKVAGTVGNLVEFGAAGAIVDSSIVAANVLTTASVLDDLADTNTSTPAAGDILRYNGGVWTGIALTKSHITDFVEGNYVHTTGVEAIAGAKTFSDNVTINANLTVTGTTTTVNSNTVEIGDSVITLNSDETGVPSQAGGIEIERGTLTNSTLLWDETADEWVAGTVGSTDPIALVGVHVAQPDYEVQVAGAVQTTFTTSLNVAAPTGTKAAEQVFVNGIKQIPGAGKHYTVSSYAPLTINFTGGNEPPTGADVEFYAFGTIS